MTGPVSWQELVAVAGMIVAAGFIVAGVVMWLMSRHQALARELDKFRLEVAEKYAPISALFKVEARIAEEFRNARKEQTEAMRDMRNEQIAGFNRVVKFVQAMTPLRRSKSAVSDE